MAAEHHELVGLVASWNLCDGVVAGAALGIAAVDDLEFELDRPLVGEETRDAAVVLVAHDDSGGAFCTSRVALSKARICPWSRPASLMRTSAPLATRN
jgi:hypothetical protein